MTVPRATGHVERDGDRHTLVLTRTFRAPIEDVWSSLTEPERLARWIGTFTGDPTDGFVMFRMTAESEDATPEKLLIRDCHPPRRLAVTSQVADAVWYLELDLVEAGGITTVTFRQPGIDPAAVGEVGPGWEYYMDRWATALGGGDAGVHDFDRDYYPAMKDHYETAAASPTT